MNSKKISDKKAVSVLRTTATANTQLLSLDEIAAGFHAIAMLEQRLENDRGFRRRMSMATASDPEAITRKIEALKTYFRNQSYEVTYQSKQKLASLLRNISSVLSDLMHAMAIQGDDTKPLEKLQSQMNSVTKSLSFAGGIEDANRNGLIDSLEDESGLMDSEDEDSEEKPEADKKDKSTEAFRAAVKSIVPEKAEAPKEATKSKKQAEPEPDPDADEGETEDETEDGESEEDSDVSDDVEDGDGESEDGEVDPDSEEDPDVDSEDGEEDGEDEEEEVPAPKKTAKPLKKGLKSKAEKSDKPKSFVDGLMAESSYQAVAGMRFVYNGLVTVKNRDGKKQKAISAGWGTHDSDTIKTYFYVPSSELLGGDAERVDKVYRRVLDTAGGYALLSTKISAEARAKKLVLLFKKELPAREALSDAKSYWSYKGIDSHPVKDNKKAIWFEIGAKEFAAIPSKKFKHGDIAETDAYIRLTLVGSKKDGAAGLGYNAGLEALNDLVSSGSLKIIYHGNV